MFYWDSINVPNKEPYILSADSKKQNGVPEGFITKYQWKSNLHYPGTREITGSKYRDNINQIGRSA